MSVELLPAESIALTVALAQVLRGETPGQNTAHVCVLALARVTGKHDWTKESIEARDQRRDGPTERERIAMCGADPVRNEELGIR